jgi:hypothetical protein
MFRVRSGAVLCYRFYDVAEAIELDQARVTLQQSSTRMKLRRAGSEYLQLHNPPLGVDIGQRTLDGTQVEVQARLFEQGAIAVMVKIPIAMGTTLEALVPIADKLYDLPELDVLGRAVANELAQALKSSVKDPHQWDQSESYTIIRLTEVEGNPTGAALLEDEALPRLIIGETKERLSASEAKTVLEHVHRYGEQDLVVIDWNAALVYDPEGGSDIADLLELANAQLLELRYYDDVLDRELGRVYDAIEARKAGRFFFSPWRGLLRELMLTVSELSELIERVENAIKIVGDVYLARVYEGTLVQLRIPQWQATVTRKFRLLREIYDLLRGEVDTRRALTLETMVVMLIMFEILMTMLKLGGH